MTTPAQVSVGGRLKKLLDRLTTTRAANLDKLDANISTRAAASTALSNATWSDARAAYLDIINTGAISGLVKSVQIVTVTMAGGSSASTAVTAVDTAKTIVLECSREHSGTSVSDGVQLLARHRLTSATNLSSTRNGTSGTLTCQVALIEIR